MEETDSLENRQGRDLTCAFCGTSLGNSKVDYSVARRAMDALIATWKEKDEQSAMLRAVGNALKAACATCGVVEGEVLTEKKAAELARVLSDRLAPFLLHLLRSRVFYPEDLEKIVRKLQEGSDGAG